MSNEERTPQAGPETPTGDLGDELAELGRRLGKTAQAAWESPEGQRFRQEMKDGFETLVRELERGLQTAKEHPSAKRVQSEVEEAWESLQRKEATQIAKQKVVEALRTVNRELSGLVDELGTPKPTEPPEEDDPPQG
ncbi:MAG: hypothetical protein GX605_07310 [Chloroflexi bacterium]|nr:hypothetical protein [Chloroflexota bacterium]